MSDFVTLTCPTCGAKLQITNDVERFACGHCRNEHIIRRSGGIVSIAKVVDGLAQVQVGTDRTAAELAIVRLNKEIQELESRKINRSREANGEISSLKYELLKAKEDLSDVRKSVAGGWLLNLMFFLWMWYFLGTADYDFRWIFVVGASLILVVSLYVTFDELPAKKEKASLAEKNIPKQIQILEKEWQVGADKIEQELSKKQNELQRNEKIVSSG